MAKRRGSFEQTVALKRREVSQGAAKGTAETVDADYQIGDLLGEGGMGAVYAARQKSMDRPVAIKVLKSRAARLASSQDAFVSEAVITGRLDHPNIVPIYDVGKQPNDALFYAMKQVEGVEWKERFAENTVSENLDILLRVADAIAFAHARGIIHRDLKPANIMLGPFGEVLVMDWGLAMPTEDHPSRETFPDARAGGTPHYMAPEMADGTERVDRRSDIYLLGAMLFEIVTGKPPHAIDIPKGTRRERVLAVLDAVADNVVVSTDKTGELLDVARKAIATEPADRYQTASEFQSALREYLTHEESIELSARAAERLAAGRQSGEYTEFSRARFGFETALEEWPENKRAAEGLQETLFDYAKTAFDRGDLDLALSMIDESDSEQEELGASIQQAIKDRNARQQQLRRLRRISLAASLTVAVVAIGAAVWIDSARVAADTERGKAVAARKIADANELEALRQEKLATANSEESERQRAIAVQREQEAQQQRQMARDAETRARRDAEKLSRQLYVNHIQLAHREWEAHNAESAWKHLNACSEDLRGWEYRYLHSLFTRNQEAIEANGGSCVSISVSPDGQLIASGGGHSVRLLNANTGNELRRLRTRPPSQVNSVAFSPDGQRIAGGCGDKTVRVWHANSGKELLVLRGHAESVASVAFSSDGNRIVTGSRDKTARLWDAGNGEEITSFNHGSEVLAVAISPDGNQVVSVANGIVSAWNVSSGTRSYTTGRHGPVTCLAFSPDGSRIASTNLKGTVMVCDATTGDELMTLLGHTDRAHSVSFSPDGSRIASCGVDSTVRMWDARTGNLVQTLVGHTFPAMSVAFSPNGRIVSGGGAQAGRFQRSEIVIWDNPEQTHFHRMRAMYLDCGPDGDRLVAADIYGPLSLVDLRTSKVLKTAQERFVACVAFSPDGRLIANGSGGGPARLPIEVRIRNSRTLEKILSLKGHTGDVRAVAFSPDSSLVASGGADGTLRLWSATTGEELRTFPGHPQGVKSVAFNSAGNVIAAASPHTSITLWDTNTGEKLLTFTGRPSGRITFNADDTMLACGGGSDNAKTLKLWNATTGEEVLSLQGHTNMIHAVAFSPDGSRIASCGDDRTVRVWDAQSGEELLTFAGYDEHVISVEFSPDGSRLLAGDRGGYRTWDTTIDRPFVRWQRKSESAEVTPASDHRIRADFAEKTGDWYAVAWHLDRLVEMNPDDDSLRQRREVAVAALRKRGLAIPRTVSDQ
jgi:WD40 repeat protein